jgi:hypothetical protein
MDSVATETPVPEPVLVAAERVPKPNLTIDGCDCAASSSDLQDVFAPVSLFQRLYGQTHRRRILFTGLVP